MSHLTNIQTQIKNADILEKVLIQMIDTGAIIGYLEHNSAIQDYYGGSSEIADFVIRRESQGNGYDFGFKRVEEEFIMAYDEDMRDTEDIMQKLLPLYARETAIASLILQGYEIESQVEENGEIKIIAGKWS